MKINQKWMLFLIASFVTCFGIINTLVKGTTANENKPINESFEDINFYECIVNSYNKQFNKNIDYMTYSLSDNELASLTVLECSGIEKQDIDKIVNTKGLEKLVSLERLDLSYNMLKEIDVSKNVNISYLNVSYNELTNIDLTNNSKLKTYILDSNINGNDNIENNTSEEGKDFVTDLPSTNIIDLKFSEGEIIFDSEITEYSITVNNFDDLKVYIQLESSTSTYMIKKSVLGEEKNISIVVNASDNTSKTYTISVIENIFSFS